jgi:hypothetical protein
MAHPARPFLIAPECIAAQCIAAQCIVAECIVAQCIVAECIGSRALAGIPHQPRNGVSDTGVLGGMPLA